MKSLLLGLSLLLALAGGLRADVVLEITEFLASNGKTPPLDQDKDYSDWIEIHNDGSDAANLLGWSLTDTTNNLVKWVFPATNLPPDGYLIVFASGKNRATAGAELHANFSLSADGEYLGLVSPEGQVASEFAPRFPKQFADVSYGIRLGRQYYYAKPTPGAANGDDGYNDFVADTKFSHDRGFYTAPFDLVISCATADAVLRCTTNGSLPSLTNGFTYTTPIRIAGTTVVRVAGFKTGFQPSNVDSMTYLFTEDIVRQSPTGTPPTGWPASWGSNVRDYGMDPDIVNDTRWRDEIQQDLRSLPSFSIVMNLNDLFNSSSGIYANPGNDGRTWERKASLELIYPDGTKGFQVDCGIRIRGGFSRSTDNPKHAFRFFFREQYGYPKLKFPLFGDDGADSFDNLDLRTFQNYSWSFQGDGRGVFIRDQGNRDLQLAMGHQAERGSYYHLYINGQYWGLYNTCERPEASYGETYFGGRKEDYDVIKVSPDNGYTSGATDGNMLAWTRLYNACKAGLTTDAAYEKIQGNNPDGTRNPDYEVLVDVDNLIDYMLVILYGGNLDAPISWFLGNASPNNWYGMRNRTGLYGGFRFFVHDAEHTLLDVNESRIGPFSAGDSSVTGSSPQWIWQKMWANAEFRLRCADRVHRHFFNGGVLSPEGVTALLQKRTNEIARAVVCESARWGDAKTSPPLSPLNWRSELDRIFGSYIPQRSSIVLTQLRSKNLYPAVVAPVFGQHGGVFDPGFRLSMTAPAGTVYYTMDGSDPRLRGGALSPVARAYQGTVPLGESVRIRARALASTNWSALNEATFYLRQGYTNLLVTEIMYHPDAPEGADPDDFEFIELKNANPFEVDLSGVAFTNGVRYTFPLGRRLGAGQFAVLVRNATNFAARYPGVTIAGVYEGSLANSGEHLALARVTGEPLFSVTFSDQLPWPVAADGQGFSLVPRNPNLNPGPNDPASWRASSRVGGSPGADDPAADLPVVLVSEALTHTDPPQLDSIELYNPNPVPADVGGWYLTDDRTVPKKFRIPASTSIPAGGYRVFTEADFNPPAGTGFLLSSHGDEVFLYSGNAAGELTGASDGFSFGAAANGVSFGRYTNSVGEVQFPAQAANSLGRANVGPRIGPVVINEINYQPAAGDAEFVELKNLTDQPIPCWHADFPTNTWRLDGLGYDFPTNTVIPARGLLVLTAGDPAAFRLAHGVPDAVPVLGPFTGVLQNSGELLELQYPDAPDLVTNNAGEVHWVVPRITIDAVRYNDKSPWPTNAAGLGASLERIQPAAYGNDPANWRASFGLPSPGLDNDGNRPPIVRAGADQQLESAVFPATADLAGSATDDNLPGGTLLPHWSQLSGPGPVVFANPDALQTQVAFPGTGQYILRLTVSDGALARSDEVAIIVNRPATQQVPLPFGSDWRYLDDGSDQGTAWRQPDFNDTAWKHGPGQLGYSTDEGDEKTVLSYGPPQDVSNKHITYYFRSHFNIPSLASVTALKLRFIRDDGIIIYLNGREAARDAMPAGDVNFKTLASTTIGGADESTPVERDGEIGLLRQGENVIAVEMHQVAANSTDISFDLELEVTAFPANQPPTVSAGPDRTALAGEPVVLNGSFVDDALPAPPGFVALQWSKVTGPGEIQFTPPDAWVTTATFTAAGEYRLRLSGNDGTATASDEVRVTVAPAVPPLQIVGLDLISSTPPVARLRFQAATGHAYVLQGRDTLEASDWLPLAEVPVQGADAIVSVDLPVSELSSSRFYRVVIKP